MGVYNQSKESDYEELELLRQKVAELEGALKSKEAAFNAQSQLLEKLVDIARSSSQGEVLQAALQTTLDVATEQTASEKGSLFLLESSGKVSEAILSRTEVTEEQRQRLIGSVLDKGLAGWVIRHQKLGLIIDAENDERWLTLPNQPYIVGSALAVPILRRNELLGIITLLHSQVGHFSKEAANLMQVTADQMSLVLENARLYSKLDEYSKALDAELEKGQQIQIDFLPYKVPQLANWEIAAYFHPAYQVAGDFYDAFELSNHHNQVGLVIADVCDKGVGAALFMALIRSLIRIFSSQSPLRGIASNILKKYEPVPGGWIGSSVATNLTHVNALQAVSQTNEYIAKNHWQMSMFATLFFGVLDPTTGLLTYINGGHETLFVVNNGSIKKTLKSTGAAVGIIPGMEYKIQQIQLEPGDIIVSYTDGVTEGKNPDGQLFTDKRLIEVLEQPQTSAANLIENIKTNLFAFIGDAQQFDDITILAVGWSDKDTM